MRRATGRNIAARARGESGLVITLVAVVLLFVVTAMAALAIDVATFYTARSQAQLVADSAALAGARVLANSGITSTSSASYVSPTTTLCQNIAALVGQQNLTTAQITVTCNLSPRYDPTVSVQVQNTSPTFFARVWGRAPVTVTASAMAEAYNPSGNSTIPVAPLCVKPWVLPNMDPTNAQIFDPASGDITTSLTGQTWLGFASSPYGSTPVGGQYYAGEVGNNSGDFPEPTQGLPACSSSLSANPPYQLAVAGCVPQPIACGAGANVNLDTSIDSTRDAETLAAVECLIHYNGNALDSDSLNGAPTATVPFDFIGGNQNPIAGAVGKQLMVSDSLVTVPVYDSSLLAPGSSVTVIGFLQLFLNPLSGTLGGPIPVTIINQVGCGTNANEPPIYGNGPSAVAVRLIHQ